MRPTIFLSLEPYHAQWLKHECDGKYPITIKRGSAEAELLQLHLRKEPRNPDFKPQIWAEPGQVEIELPAFKSLDTRTYRYLPPAGAAC